MIDNLNRHGLVMLADLDPQYRASAEVARRLIGHLGGDIGDRMRAARLRRDWAEVSRLADQMTRLVSYAGGGMAEAAERAGPGPVILHAGPDYQGDVARMVEAYEAAEGGA